MLLRKARTLFVRCLFLPRKSLNLCELLDWDGDLFFDLFARGVNGLEIGLDLLQVRASEILLSAIFAFFAGHIIDHKEMIVMPVDVLNVSHSEIFVAAETANLVHRSPLS